MKLLFSTLILTLFSFVLSDDCGCRIKTENRVVNGQFAIEHSIPWIVSLAYKTGAHFCGGSILNEMYILTASHCTENLKAKDIVVRAGVHDIKEEIPKNQTYRVKKIHQKNFKNLGKPGDIAILELESEISFVEGKIEKGCFNLDKREYSEPLLAAGWGYTEKSYIDPKTKNWVYNGHPDKLKQMFYKQNNKCKDYLVCLNPVNEGDSVCQGDSGSPIHFTENGFTKIEGVGSFVSGFKEHEGKQFVCNGDAFYSRLSYYADWISKTAKYNFCGTHEKKKLFGLF